MDLTPPSLTRSPASPTHTYCPSERSSLDYPSPGLATQQYKLVSLYAAGQLGSLGEADPSLPHLDSAATADWVSTNEMASTSSSLSIPNVLSSEYDPFADYHPPMPPYGSEAYPPPPLHSSSVGNQPHPLTDASGRSPAPSSSRSSFSYITGGHPTGHIGPRIKMENSNDYGSGIDVAQYPSPRSMQAPYLTEPSHYPNSHQSYLSDAHSPAWSKSELDAESYYHHSPVGDLGPADHGSKRGEYLKPNQPKKSQRKMTTAEDANYQCEVKGCGKLFGRSYNYKAHMETHDEKREYPFPCPVADCNKRFVRKTDLQRHNQSVHMKERNHKCDYCGRLFARKDTLRRHMGDGCSKRFDVGTCDLRVDGYEGMGALNRNIGEHVHSMGHDTLPPITMPTASGSGLLHPASSASRSRSIISGTGEGTQGGHWPR